MLKSHAAVDDEYTGLLDLAPGLPSSAYFDPQVHARELKAIWFRHWIYVGRSTELPHARSFLTFELGDQRLLVVRDAGGELKAFHNTCRHRGAALCRETHGRLKSDALVCPYHAWRYDLRGRLLRTSSKHHPRGFDAAMLGLYEVSVREWRGFIFIALSEEPPPFEQIFDQPLDRLDAWPLDHLVVAHVLEKTLECNWKVFWENYNECLHCPSVHSALSQLVPIYGRGLLEERDDPQWRSHAADPDPKFKGGLREDARTWSLDGRLTGVPFDGVSKADQQSGALYMTGLPSVFIVGHLDYVRVVRLKPLAPERTQLWVEYLFSPASLAAPGFDLRNVVEFTDRVMSEDAEVCEINQRGLHATPHENGFVMPEEYVIRQFHQWIAAELARGR